MTVEIPLNSRKYPGLVALVDDEDYEKVSGHSWRVEVARNTFYALSDVRRDDGRRSTVRMHRLVLSGPVVDHVNRSGLDNRRANLRAASRSQNAMNQASRANTSSRYKGVSWDKYARKWDVRIRAKGRQLRLGRFTSELEAARAYDRAAIEHFGEFACINFPNELTGVAE